VTLNLNKTLEDALSHHISAVQSISVDSLKSIYDLIATTYAIGRRVFIAGNGGSAADAQHIAAELVGRFKKDRRALSAIALTTDTSCLTAIANDYSFEDIFVRQLEAHFEPGDLLWLLSVSGSSPNVVNAAKKAKELGGKVLLFTSMKCEEISELSDAFLEVPSISSDVVQECHQFAYHILCDCSACVSA